MKFCECCGLPLSECKRRPEPRPPRFRIIKTWNPIDSAFDPEELLWLARECVAAGEGATTTILDHPKFGKTLVLYHGPYIDDDHPEPDLQRELAATIELRRKGIA